MSKQIKVWSYSSLKTYKQCPRKLKLNKIDKIKEPTSAPMERGTEIHAIAEAYIVEKQKRLPMELVRFHDEFEALQKTNAHAEEEWGFTKEWEPCGWIAPNVWVRAKLDSYYTEGTHLTLIDYKTGKVYAENKGQCSFYALLAFIMFPEIQTIHVELWYLDAGDKQEDDYERSEMDEMKLWWEHEIRPMLADTIFAPRPSFKCKWCFYSCNKNGNCEF